MFELNCKYIQHRFQFIDHFKIKSRQLSTIDRLKCPLDSFFYPTFSDWFSFLLFPVTLVDAPLVSRRYSSRCFSLLDIFHIVPFFLASTDELWQDIRLDTMIQYLYMSIIHMYTHIHVYIYTYMCFYVSLDARIDYFSLVSYSTFLSFFALFLFIYLSTESFLLADIEYVCAWLCCCFFFLKIGYCWNNCWSDIIIDWIAPSTIEIYVCR